MKVSICIACHNQGHLLKEALESCFMQNYEGIEVVVLIDACTDNTTKVCDDFGFFLMKNYEEVGRGWDRGNLKYYGSNEPSGTGEAFNKAIAEATGDIIVLLCADDVFTDVHVISDIVVCFEHIQEIGHVSRWYHQFTDGDRHPVRAWRGENEIELANNPSGLAFRKIAIDGKGLTNRMFVEASQLVKDVLKDGWAYSILRYDTVAVRVHKSISRTPGYYKKMWNTSPVEEWAKLGWKSRDYTHLIQVGVNFTKKAVWDEAKRFIEYDFRTIFRIDFWFIVVVVLLTPRQLLYKLPEWYRATIGRWTTREVKRP